MARPVLPSAEKTDREVSMVGGLPLGLKSLLTFAQGRGQGPARIEIALASLNLWVNLKRSFKTNVLILGGLGLFREGQEALAVERDAQEAPPTCRRTL